MTDAERLATLIERLADRGQKAPAAEAAKIADLVELLSSQLVSEIDDFLAV